MNRFVLLAGMAFSFYRMGFCFDVNFDIATGEGNHPISPLIYGTNQELLGDENWSMLRLGGNRLTGYNWENNASNAGSDWQHSSDGYLSSSSTPGLAVTNFHDKALTYGAYSLVTVQLAGYVAKDKAGTVGEDEAAPSSRWVEAIAAKGSPFELIPDLLDNAVYIDEFVNFLVDKYGTAKSEQGVDAYSLDNEPALWSGTHPRLHPDAALCTEVASKAVTFSRAIKAVDPDAQIYGPALYGFAAFNDFQGADDWSDVKGNYEWFIDYYLAEMKKAHDEDGKRLLDVLDVHWYPEAKGDNRIVFDGTSSAADIQARLQAPRTLWDSTYSEDSWVAQWGSDFLPLLPKLKSSIDKYYPGTKLAITEYHYGGGDHFSGGLAQADILGIFGQQNLYAATLWKIGSEQEFVSAAFKLFRNYDGENSVYGDVSVKAISGDTEKASIYAATRSSDESILHLIAINKDTAQSMNSVFSISANRQFVSGNVWGFDKNSSSVTARQPVETFSGNTFTYEIPAGSAYHFVLQSSDVKVNMARQNRRSANALVSIYDLNGRVIYSGSQTRNYKTNVPHRLTKGIYIIKTAQKGVYMTQKLIMQ